MAKMSAIIGRPSFHLHANTNRRVILFFNRKNKLVDGWHDGFVSRDDFGETFRAGQRILSTCSAVCDATLRVATEFDREIDPILFRRAMTLSS